MRGRMRVKVQVAGLVDRNLPPVKAEVAGSNPVRTAKSYRQNLPVGSDRIVLWRARLGAPQLFPAVGWWVILSRLVAGW
jgi:hypothetical protein